MNRHSPQESPKPSDLAGDGEARRDLAEIRVLLNTLVEDDRRAVTDSALALSLSRRLEAAQALIEDLQSRLETQAAELYVARSDQQRSAVLADDLRARLSAATAPDSSTRPETD